MTQSQKRRLKRWIMREIDRNLSRAPLSSAQHRYMRPVTIPSRGGMPLRSDVCRLERRGGLTGRRMSKAAVTAPAASRSSVGCDRTNSLVPSGRTKHISVARTTRACFSAAAIGHRSCGRGVPSGLSRRQAPLQRALPSWAESPTERQRRRCSRSASRLHRRVEGATISETARRTEGSWFQSTPSTSKSMLQFTPEHRTSHDGRARHARCKHFAAPICRGSLRAMSVR